MVNLKLDDPNLIENVKAIQALQKSGLFTDAEIQKMYDEQVEKDKAQMNN